MRYNLLILLIFGSLFSCKKDAKNVGDLDAELIAEDPYIVPTDTIAERTQPAVLDLKQYQLFIDTTRTSEAYKELDANITSEEKKQHNALYKLVELKKYKDQFLLYKPCQGDIARYYISKEKITLYTRLENEEIALKNFMLKSGNRVLYKDIEDATLSLKEIDEKVIQLKYDHLDHPVYVTSTENINEFEMMINHCLGEKVREFDRFEE